MSALSGSSVMNKAFSKKQAASGNFFQVAPTMSAQVPRVQVNGASSVGFQASSFFSTALANTGFQAGRKAAAPRSNIVMKAGGAGSTKSDCVKLLTNTQKRNMKFVSLVSGGKNSVFNTLQCISYGHELVCVANLYPKKGEIDS